MTNINIEALVEEIKRLSKKLESVEAEVDDLKRYQEVDRKAITNLEKEVSEIKVGIRDIAQITTDIAEDISDIKKDTSNMKVDMAKYAGVFVATTAIIAFIITNPKFISALLALL